VAGIDCTGSSTYSPKAIVTRVNDTSTNVFTGVDESSTYSTEVIVICPDYTGSSTYSTRQLLPASTTPAAAPKGQRRY